MRQIMYAGCLLAFAMGCRPAQQSTAAAQSPSQSKDTGKIPITTRSEDARALFLRGRVLNENLQTQQLYDRAITEFRAAIALNPQYSLAYNQLGYAYRWRAG